MAPPWLDAAAARRRRVRLLLPIALGVLLSHLWLAERLADGLAGARGGHKAPPRLQVAFLREMQPSDPPAPSAPAPDAPGAARTATPRPDAPRAAARLQVPDTAASAAEAAERAAAERSAAQRAAEKAAAEKAAAERFAAERAAEREARLARALAAVAAAGATGKATGAVPEGTGPGAREGQATTGAAHGAPPVAEATASEDPNAGAPGASPLAAASPAAPAGSAGAPAAIPGRPGGEAAAATASPGAPVVGPPATATPPGGSAAGPLHTAASPAAATAATGATAATTATAATRFEWPPSTRITYRLVGFVRGLVEGSARVEWLREGERYQVHLDVLVGPSFAPIVQRHMSSDGAITAEGLAPRRYDEQTDVAFARGRSVSMAFDGDGVTLGDGRRAARLPGVQDTASQFVQMTYLFRAGARRLETGAQIEMPLALPKRVDRWIYDVVGEEALETPFGTVPAWHLKPRRIGDPSTLAVEAWFAPRLQYLPVRIVIRDGRSEDNYIDLLIDRLPQQAVAAPPATAASAASAPP